MSIVSKGLLLSSVLGGATSMLGGGKFANGAVTAAFAYVASGGLSSHTDSADSGESVQQEKMDYGTWYRKVRSLDLDPDNIKPDGADVAAIRDILAKHPDAAAQFWSTMHSTLWSDMSCGACEIPSAGQIRLYYNMHDQLVVEVAAGTAMPAPKIGVQDMPDPDLSKGILLVAGHPHPSGDPMPSPVDLQTSARNHAPFVVLPAGKAPVWYQGHCLTPSC